jgi:hypothetical protein
MCLLSDVYSGRQPMASRLPGCSRDAYSTRIFGLGAYSASERVHLISVHPLIDVHLTGVHLTHRRASHS